jgi:hypothetical protein
MSYDLYLIARTGEFDEAAFEAYFRERNGYALQGGQAWYENKDAGVYFSFELPDPEGAEDREGPTERTPSRRAIGYGLREGFL